MLRLQGGVSSEREHYIDDSAYVNTEALLFRAEKHSKAEPFPTPFRHRRRTSTDQDPLERQTVEHLDPDT